jgi:hypothetical protein
MLVLFCVQVVQINKFKSEKEKNFQMSISKRYVNLLRKKEIFIKNFNWQNTQVNN